MHYPPNQRREAEAYVRRHQCGTPDCKGALVVAWDGPQNSYVVRCGLCGTEAIARRRSMTEMYLAGEIADLPIIHRMEKKMGVEPADSTALMAMDETRMERRLKLGFQRFGWSLVPAQQPIMIELARQYGLDPFMGELILYEGKPYIGIQAYRRKATEHPRYLTHSVKPVVDATLKKALGYADDDVVAECRLWLQGAPEPVLGYARANPTRPYRNNPVEKSEPWVMAAKRAEMRTIKAGIGLNLPAALTADYDELSGSIMPLDDEPLARTVDEATGEIIEGTATELDATPRGPTLAELAERAITLGVATQQQFDDWLKRRGQGAETLDEAPEDAKEALKHELANRIAAKQEQAA